MSSVNRDSCTSSFSILILLFYYLAWLLCLRLLVRGWMSGERLPCCFCCCSATQLCPTLCHPMGCSTPGLSVPHHLPKFAQVHVHCIGDAIQPSHLLIPSSPSALNLSQHQGLSNESAVHIRWPKYWSFKFSISSSNEYSGLISVKINWFDPPCVAPNLRGKSFQSFIIDYDISWWRTGKPGVL